MIERMIELWRRSTLLGRILFPLAVGLFTAQLFFVSDYSNDKTILVEQMARSYSTFGGIAGRDIACRDFATGLRSAHALWIEEFPIFPYTAAAIAKISPGDVWRRWTPWIFHALTWALLALVLYRYAYGRRPEYLEIVALYGVLPITVIHATKVLPDPAVISLALGGVALFLARRPFASLPFFFLAGLTKPLALALVAPFALGWMILGEGDRRRRWGWGLGAGVATLAGVVAWIVFLYVSDIDNPLLRNAAYRESFLNAATNPANVAIGAKISALQYASRYFTWVALRGVSIPLFLAAVAGLYFLLHRRAAELRGAPVFVRMAAFMALFSPIYWILVRGPQYTGPWYSLYVLPGVFTVAAFGYLRIASIRWRALIALLVLVSALPKIQWSVDSLAAYRAPIGSAFRDPGDHVDCSVSPIMRAVF